MAKAISVDIGMHTPLIYCVFLLNTKKIIAGTMTPPKDAITGKDAFFKEDKEPYITSSFISSPANKKNIAIRKSFTKL